jgi:hypothetical protein
MRNTGETNWTADGPYPYLLGIWNPQDSTIWGPSRVGLPVSSVAPGETVTFTFAVTAPSQPGIHNFQWRMLQEQVTWFGDSTQHVPVAVTRPQVAAHIEPHPVRLGRPIQYIVRVTDPQTGAALGGTVSVRNPGAQVQEFPTNTPFTFTFRVARRVRVDREDGREIEVIPPEAWVTVPGYSRATLELGVD